MFEIGRATEVEIAGIAGPVPLEGALTDVLDDWQLIAVRTMPDADIGSGDSMVLGLHLVGVARGKRRAVCTSPVTVLDLADNRARTYSGSLYLLAEEATAPMSRRAMLHMVRHLLSE